MDNFNQTYVENLFIKIEKFYKRFYINKLVKGLLTTIAVVLAVFLLFNFVFFYLSIPTVLRYTLFYSLVFILFATLYFWVVIPILRLLKMSKGLSTEDSSVVIGNYFTEVGDSLLNTVQMNTLVKGNDLAQAAMIQNSRNLATYNFEEAVPSLNADKKVFWIFAPVALLLLVFFVNSQVLVEGSSRLYNYEVDYSTIAPFTFEINNQETQIIEGEDIILGVALVGQEIPNSIEIEVNGVLYGTKKGTLGFEFLANNVSKDLRYRFKAGRFYSEFGQVLVVGKSRITKLSVSVSNPIYSGLGIETYINKTVLTVLKGSATNWNVETVNARAVELFINEELVFKGRSEDLALSTVITESGPFEVILTNDLNGRESGFTGEVIMVVDQFPSILLEPVNDSTLEEGDLYSGIIQDDFGFKDLRVVVKVGDSLITEKVKIGSRSTMQKFSYVLPKSDAENSAVWFEVRDNDVIGGFKKTKSSVFYRIAEKSNEGDMDESSKEIKEDLKMVIEKRKDLALDMENIQKDLLEKKEMSWSDKKRMEDALNKEKSLDKELQKLNEKIQAYHKELNESQKTSPETLEKQKQLEKLMERLLNEENKELMKELQEMMDAMDKDKLQKQLEELKKNQESYEEELDRDLEIFKEMEVEQKMEEALNDISDLAQKQDSLAEKNKEKDFDLEENSKEQEKINEEFKELEESLKELDSLNKELDSPKEMDLDEEKKDEAKKQMDEALKKSKEGEKEDSSEKQEEAAKSLEEMKKKMEDSLSMSSSSQEGEDLEALRKILENLLVLSFDQEVILKEVSGIKTQDPRIVFITQEQLALLSNSELVRDSLMALSARVPQIEATVSEELDLIRINMEGSIENLKERKLREGTIQQQKSLTSINNLALLLDEIIQQMQEQQKKKNKGDGSCSKPGEGKPSPSMGDSKKKQADLAKKMEAMKKKMEKGKMPGKMNPGAAGKGMSMEVAKMAAQQEQIRQEIRKMRDELQKEGNLNGAGSLKELERMLEENEEDLINLKFDRDFLSRQENIEIKMLEADNALREREREKKRESNSAKNLRAPDSEALQEYLKLKNTELELLRLANPDFSQYYKSKVGQYNLK